MGLYKNENYGPERRPGLPQHNTAIAVETVRQVIKGVF